MIVILKSSLLHKFTGGFLVGIAIMMGSQPSLVSDIVHAIGA